MLSKLDKTKLPQHVAVIMDGNGRYAKSQGLPRLEGHRKGADVVEDVTEFAREIGIKFITLYAFSKENWQRPAEETQGLMMLLTEFLVGKKSKMIKNGIRLSAIGDLSQLPAPVSELLSQTITETAGGREMGLTLALSYSARDEILRAVRRVSRDVVSSKISADHVTEELFSSYLDTREMPDPDLIIRTSGEKRVSNFLLWQGAYAEFVFVEENWPEFNRDLFVKCLLEYQQRERRFGLTSEQLD